MPLALAFLLLAAAGDAADTPLVERVEITQNQFLQPEALLFYVSTKAGDRYDELHRRLDPSHGRAFLEPELAAVFPDGVTLTSAETGSIRLPMAEPNTTK